MDTDNLYKSYKQHGRSRSLFLSLAVGILILTMIAGICTGSSNINLQEVITSLCSNSGLSHSIIWELRMPRVVLGALVGFGLAIAGTIFQAILWNPLASPFTLGIGSGAGFGAVTAIIFGGGSFHMWRVVCGSFLFSLVSACIILAVAKMTRTTSETMILTGIAQMFLFSSLTSLFQYMGTMEQVYEIVFWFFGSLSKAGWQEITLSAIVILLPFPLLLRWAWDLNLLCLGDETALALGVNVEFLRVATLAFASLITAGCICFTGIIGFVGLVAPHISRMLIGNDHQFLLPSAGLVGAIIVVTADIISRSIWAPQVIPIGIVTSFIGVPFFAYLLLRRTREYW